jgi:hypothetical protein
MNLSLCSECYCMTKTIKGKCGKCKKTKYHRPTKGSLASDYQDVHLNDHKTLLTDEEVRRGQSY